MSDPIQRLVSEFSRLPGVGEKTAARFVFYLLAGNTAQARELAEALTSLAERVRLCSVCGFPSEQDRCRYCADPRRDDALICVVERPPDLLSIERTGEFRGRYHVLHGVINPLEGVGPNELNLRTLLSRTTGLREVIVATSPTVEGDATALYLHRLLTGAGVSVTRLATGLSVGTGIEYADRATLAQALNARRPVG